MKDETVKVTFMVRVENDTWNYKDRLRGEAEATLDISTDALAYIDPTQFLRGLLEVAADRYEMAAHKEEAEDDAEE